MYYEINNKYVAMFLKAGFWLQGEVGEKRFHFNISTMRKNTCTQGADPSP